MRWLPWLQARATGPKLTGTDWLAAVAMALG